MQRVHRILAVEVGQTFGLVFPCREGENHHLSGRERVEVLVFNLTDKGGFKERGRRLPGGETPHAGAAQAPGRATS